MVARERVAITLSFTVLSPLATAVGMRSLMCRPLGVTAPSSEPFFCDEPPHPAKPPVTTNAASAAQLPCRSTSPPVRLVGSFPAVSGPETGGVRHSCGMRVNYDEHQHAVYSAGRELNASRIELWTGIFSRWIDRSARPEIVDVGSGNGMYSELLADRFDARVTGAEPSVRMRELAEREHAHPGVRYVEGSAEVLPLADGSQAAALLSNVIQHFRDRDAAAREVARVLRPGGLV